jgi:hypothetical protein
MSSIPVNPVAHGESARLPGGAMVVMAAEMRIPSSSHAQISWNSR